LIKKISICILNYYRYGIFGESTQAAVRKFQEIFDLPVTGIVDFPTWYKISDMYVRLSRIAELN